MDTQITRTGDIFQYIAGKTETSTVSDGYYFRLLSGTPSISGNTVILNADEIETMQSFGLGSAEIELLIPVAPTSGDARSFGFKNTADSNKGRAEFDIAGTAFTAQVYDSAGTLVVSKTIDWDTDWTNTAVRYRISRSERMVIFTINDVVVATVDGNGGDIAPATILSKNPMAIHINNSNSDNMALTQISQF